MLSCLMIPNSKVAAESLMPQGKLFEIKQEDFKDFQIFFIRTAMGEIGSTVMDVLKVGALSVLKKSVLNEVSIIHRGPITLFTKM